MKHKTITIKNSDKVSAAIGKIRNHLQKDLPGVEISNQEIIIYSVFQVAESLLEHKGDVK